MNLCNQMIVDLVLINILAIVSLKSYRVYSARCDSSLHSPLIPGEGVIGPTGAFPWVGILRVYLPEVGSISVAITGIVYVKEGFAIANADDVARIPKLIFRRQGEAMFIPIESRAWTCRVKDYLTHPEYKQRIVNTVAIVKLELGDGGEEEGKGLFPMKPVCWPEYLYNTSKLLYVVGFTDENGPLEKFIHKAAYVDLQSCKEFYTKSTMSEGSAPPAQFACVFAERVQDSCVWDSGVLLLSNLTGYWTIQGFGLLGPGCASPARMIAVTSYYDWIDIATTKEWDDIGTEPAKQYVEPVEGDILTSNEGNAEFRQNKDSKGYTDKGIFEHTADMTRKSDNDYVYHAPEWERPNMAWHTRPKDPQDLFTSWNYPFSIGSVETDTFTIDRIDKDAIQITNITGGKHDDCNMENNRLIYHEDTHINATTGFKPFTRRFAVYKISLYDLHYYNYSCVIIDVKSPHQEQAMLYYRLVIAAADEASADAGSTFSDKTPEEIQKAYFLMQPGSFYNSSQKEGTAWSPGPHMRLVTLTDNDDRNIENLNLYIRFVFYQTAKFSIRVFGPPHEARVLRTTTMKRPTYTTSRVDSEPSVKP